MQKEAGIGPVLKEGSDCDTVCRAVASNTKDPWFESCHWQIFMYYQLY